jgi:hypothetical protein
MIRQTPAAGVEPCRHHKTDWVWGVLMVVQDRRKAERLLSLQPFFFLFFLRFRSVTGNSNQAKFLGGKGGLVQFGFLGSFRE